MAHYDKIHAERLCPDGDFEYRLGTSRHFQRQSARARGLSDEDVQRYRESLMDSKKGWVRDFEVDRIVGRDGRNSLVVFKPHYQTGAEIRPGWFRHDVIAIEHVQRYNVLVAEADQEYHAMNEGSVEQVVNSKFARPSQDLFSAQIEKPVGKKLREVILERYPEAFRKEDAIEGDNADRREDPGLSIRVERDIANGRKVEDIVVPFYNMATGILGEDDTHYFFLNSGGSTRWVAKGHMTADWTKTYEKHKAGLINAFQFYSGGKEDFQGTFRPDLWLHGDGALFLAVPFSVLQANRGELGSRHPELLADA